MLTGTAALQTAETAGSGTTSYGKPYSGDTVSVTGTATGTYNTKDVATASIVTFAGLSLTGTTSGDYSLTASSQSASITPKALTYSGLSVPSSKVYDDATTATVTGTAALQTAESAGSGTTSDGKPYNGDTVNVTGTATGTYNTKDVATASIVTFAGLSLTGTTSGDYTLTTSSQSASITPKDLTYTGLTVPAQTYDGTTTAAVSGTAALASAESTGSGSTSDGLPYSGDTVSITGTATGSYNSKDVDTASVVTFAGVSLAGRGQRRLQPHDLEPDGKHHAQGFELQRPIHSRQQGLRRHGVGDGQRHGGPGVRGIDGRRQHERWPALQRRYGQRDGHGHRQLQQQGR